ncbi:hypothetical protein ABZ896_11935 [Streptomyces sp. NPDC047072]|uniref:hypothetical protein n=1 Tax=Streptomyces sp. NPDC047072 TaxID=3154809 RepID=UPI0033FC30A9
MGEQRDSGETPHRGPVRPASADAGGDGSAGGGGRAQAAYDGGRAGAAYGGGAAGPSRSGRAAEVVSRSVLEDVLAGAVREVKPDEVAEGRAVAAFTAARDAGAHRARTRRRDDWRPREKRRTARSLKATLSVFLASLTLGGVAVAAIGAVDGQDRAGESGGHRTPSAVASTPDRAGTGVSGSAPATPAPADRPDTAQDTEAHCRAYEKVAGHGQALDSTAWQRLITAAGGATNVGAYCAARLDDTTATDAPGNSGSQGNAPKDTGGNADKNSGKGKSGKQ